MTRETRSTGLTLGALPCAAALLLSGCQKAQEPPPAHRVENPAMGVAIAALPDAFRVMTTESTRIDLELIEGQGRLEIVAMEPESSINLVTAVRDHQASILGRPGGSYNGGNELMLTALPGAAYYSRGRFEGDQGLLEEVQVFMIHPWKDRQLRATYTYPAGEDSKDRLENQLFAVVSELEGLPEPDAAAPPDEG